MTDEEIYRAEMLRQMRSAVWDLSRMGESDMGFVSYSHARRFHTIVDNLTRLVADIAAAQARVEERQR